MSVGKTLATVIAASTVLLSACSAGVSQSKICVAAPDQVAETCKAGEMVFVKPQSWGNDQYPLLLTAAFCDLNHQVVQSPGGVVCVYTDKRLKQFE